MPRLCPRQATLLGWLCCSAGCGAPEPTDPSCVTAPDHGTPSCLDGLDTLPEDASALGCFALGADGRLVPSPELVAYEVNAPLFSDFADKQRLLYLPPGTALTADGEAVSLPVGAALFKHFAREGVPIETRVIHQEATGPTYVSYAWEGGVARQVPTGAQLVLDLPSGAATWAVPSRDECAYCHGADQPLLGLSPAQLDREVCVDGVAADQLATWAQWGLGALSSTAPLAAADSDRSVEDRARSALHANCAHCHRPGGWAVDVDLDLRFATPVDQARLCGVPNQYFAGSASPTTRLVPGDPAASSVLWRMETDSDARMPPFGVDVDPTGTRLVREWIQSLQACP